MELSFSAQSGSMLVRIVYCSSAASRYPSPADIGRGVVSLAVIRLQAIDCRNDSIASFNLFNSKYASPILFGAIASPGFNAESWRKLRSLR
jgi:hypothetical protein